MGFGAGFASGFVPAYQAQKQRSHERETDEFRYRMETLIKKKEKYDEYKKQDAQYSAQATDLAQLYGQPPEAAADIYKMLRNDTPKEVIIDSLKGGKFKVKKAAEASEEPVEAPADAQMRESGLNTEPSTQPAPVAAQAPSFDGGGFLQKAFPGMKKFVGPGRQARQDARVSQASGMSPEEMAAVDQGYTPDPIPESGLEYVPSAQTTNDPIEARRLMDEARYAASQNPEDLELQEAVAETTRQYVSLLKGTLGKSQVSDVAVAAGRAIGTTSVVASQPDGSKKVITANQTINDETGDTQYVDPMTNEVLQARPILPEEKEMGDKIAANLADDFAAHDADAQNLAAAYSAYGNARKLIEADESIISDRAADADQYIIDLGKDIATGMDIITGVLADPASAASVDPSAIEKTKADLEAALASDKLGAPQRIAANRGILKAQYALGAYHLASAVGQSDKNVAENERKMLTDLPKQATSLAAWDKLIGSVLAPRKQMLDQMAQRLPQKDPKFKPFFDQFGYSPVGDLNPMEVYIKDIPEAADLDRVLPSSGFATVAPEQKDEVPKPEDAAPADYPGYTYTGKMTPDGKKLYKDAQGNIGTMD